MDAVILAGGFARRMGTLTTHFPKCLLEVQGKPIVQHIIERLHQQGGIGHIYLSSNQRFAPHFAAFLERHSFTHPVTLVVENSLKEDEKLGSVGALAFLLSHHHLQNDLLVIGGDNLFRFSLGDFLDFYHRHRQPLIGVVDIGSVEEARKLGVVSLNHNHRIVDFQEKPDTPSSTLVSTAIYLFPHRTLPRISEYVKSGHNPDKLGYFIAWLAKNEPVNGFVFTDKWFDIGSVDTYERAKREY